MAPTTQTIKEVSVVHSMPLLSAPSFNASLIAWAWPNTTFDVETIRDGFAEVKLGNGGTAFLAQAACEPNALGFDMKPQTTFLTQPVLLYAKPLPGGQFSVDGKYNAELLIQTDEELVVLGKDSLFVLIQNKRGWLGYVPRVLCRDKAIQAGVAAWEARVLLVGIGWTIAQLASITAVGRTFLPFDRRTLHIGISIAMLILGLLLALISPRPAVARAFAVGMGLVILLSQCSMLV